MNAKKFSLLVVINPNASRAEEALPKLTEWFAENTNAILMIAHRKKDLKALLKVHGPEADRIVIGGGDGTLSKALPALLKLKKPLAVLPLGTARALSGFPPTRSRPPRLRLADASTESMWASPTASLISMWRASGSPQR